MTLAHEGGGGRPPQPPPGPMQPPSQPQPGAGGAADAGNGDRAALDKVARRKLKKLRKKIRSGLVSRAQAEECAKHGLVVKAEADWGPEMLEGKRGALSPADLRQAILHVVTAGNNARCPSWLRLVNGGLLGGVVVVGLAGVDPAYLKENITQLPFLAACTRPMPLRLYHGPHPRRSIFSLLFYRPKEKEKRKLAASKAAGRSRSDSAVSATGCLPSDEEPEEGDGREEEEDDDDDDLAEEDAAVMAQPDADVGAGMDDDDERTVSVEPFEQYVMGMTQLKLAGYPLPPQDLAGRVRRPNSKGMLAAAVGEEDEDDIGCPMDWGEALEEEGEEAVAAEAEAGGPAWLECDAEGKWGGTAGGALVPTLEEAQRILGTLDGVKVGGLNLCFYETLGGRDPEATPPPYKMAALDCEMCQTAQGMEVTRLTLVDGERRVLLDSFVKPYSPITDYHTRYSGITAEIMAGCETRLEQVQVALLRLVRADTVLVGHSLEQDLLVTGLIHLRCIDTGLLYPHPRGHHCRYALRVLAKKYLHRVIQNAATGHCSQEDAVAALDLVQLKVENGPEFGVEDGAGGPCGGGEGGGAEAHHGARNRASFLDRLTAVGKRCALLDQSDALVQVVRGGASAVVCRSNEEVLAKAKAQAKQALAPDFLWGSLAAARPLTLDTWESRRKRKIYQQQQQQQRYMRQSSSTASLASIASSSSAEGGGGGGGKRVRLSDLGSPTATTIVTPLAAADSVVLPQGGVGGARKHTKFTYEEHIMDLVEPALLRADQQLAELFDALPTNTLLMVVAQPDVALAATLHAQRATALRSGARATLPWTEKHEEVLKELCGAAQRGLVLLRVR